MRKVARPGEDTWSGGQDTVGRPRLRARGQ